MIARAHCHVYCCVCCHGNMCGSWLAGQLLIVLSYVMMAHCFRISDNGIIVVVDGCTVYWCPGPGCLMIWRYTHDVMLPWSPQCMSNLFHGGVISYHHGPILGFNGLFHGCSVRLVMPQCSWCSWTITVNGNVSLICHNLVQTCEGKI